MEEFIFEDKVEDLCELIGSSKIQQCWIVVNAELFMQSPHRFFYLPSHSPNQVREQLVLEAFKEGLDKYVWPKQKRKSEK